MDHADLAFLLMAVLHNKPILNCNEPAGQSVPPCSSWELPGGAVGRGRSKFNVTY